MPPSRLESAKTRALSLCAVYVAFGSLCTIAGLGCGEGANAGSPGSDDSGTTAATGGSGSSSGGSSGGGSSGGSSSGGSVDDGGASGDDGGAGSVLPDGRPGSGLDDGAVSADGGLNPSVAPGGNFDLSVWELQEPVGSPGAPTTILPAQLEGPSGYHDTYFFTDPTDGSMSFWDPENGVTTANSNYPRSELREMTPAGAAANWPSSGTNTLSATLKVRQVPDHVAVGQIHLGTGTPASTKPLLELFYYATGAIQIGIEQTPAGGNEVETPVGNVPLDTKWSYVIGLTGNTITLTIDGGAAQTFAMSSTFDEENMYFKAGDYDQSVGTSGTVGAKVQFYSLDVFHGP
ncbi:MAG: polysaccharide lyase family 7 protein [Polyangiaceae bacterium]